MGLRDSIYWGLPSSEVVALAKNDRVTPSQEVKGQFEHAFDAVEATAKPAEAAPANTAKSYTSTTLDYIANVDMLTYSGYAAVKIGDYYYTSSHTGGGIVIIDQFNDKVGVINPPKLGIVMSMYYDEAENLLYCGTVTDIQTIDLDKPTEIKDNYPVPARFLAYVPELDGGKGGFVAGTEHECNTYIWEDGELVLDQKNYLDFGPIYAMGAAYHNKRLYVSSASGYYYNEVYVYDFAKKERIGEPVQVVEDPALYNLMTMNGNEYLANNLSSVSMAGGLSVCKLEDGTTALGMVFQCSYITSRLMLLELESSADVKGYNLYRSMDGAAYAKVNDAPMPTRRYTESLSQAGKYTYYVEVLSEKTDEPSVPSPYDTIAIAEHSTCPKPDFSVTESNGWAMLEWLPNASDNVLVGFDLYRDDERIGRYWINDMRWMHIDETTELGVPYTYRIEAVYGDGCVADSTLSITLTGQGFAKEPFGLELSAKKAGANSYDVTAKWETPLFEDPLVLRYCNGFDAQPIAFDNFYQCWGVIAWVGHELDIYRDLYLVGMEYGIGNTPKTYEAIVILNDKLVYTQPIQRPITNGFQTVMFNQSFPMDQPQEVVVGFHTEYSPETNGVLLCDPTVTVDGRSNLVSLDGYQWSTLKAGKITGSWMLSALVVHKRDLEAAKRADGTIDGEKLAGSIIRMAANNEPLDAKIKTLPTVAAFKPSAKAGFNLTGFNVYRRQADAETEIKLNDEPLTTFEWTDKALPEDEYDYYVDAVYSDGQAIRAHKYIVLGVANEDPNAMLQLNVYPNPATEWLNVEGEYQTLQIFDFGGRLLRTQPAANQIQLGDLKPGTYLLHFTGADARKAVYKIVVR
ncbi:MAG: T9SS type A sorting domain-containing protein [Bacteroidales bacterium]|nr:T9SS type A sorting domain-containing protein [Bacteroidales bacterium]